MMADNEALPPKDAVDSRTFGPLPLGAIFGRIMYAARSETDHGAFPFMRAWQRVVWQPSAHLKVCGCRA